MARQEKAREREREGFPEAGRRFIIVDTRVRLFGGGWWPRAGFDVTTDSRDAAESLVPLAGRPRTYPTLPIRVFAERRWPGYYPVIYYDHARLVVHGPAYRFLNRVAPSPPIEVTFRSSTGHLPRDAS